MSVRNLLKDFIYSNLYVAIVLTLLTASSYSMLHYTLSFKWYVPVSVFLGSFVLYTFHRLYKIDFIPVNSLEERHRWVLKRAEWMKYLMSFAVFLLLLILPNFKADTVVWLIPAGIISIGYTIPIIPTRIGWQRFRDIPLTKPLIIAVVVSYLSLAYPIFEQMGISTVFAPHIFPVITERMLFLLAVTIPFDSRDIKNDRDAGLDTLGTRLGFETSRKIAGVVSGVWALVVLGRCFMLEAPIEYWVQPVVMGFFLGLALWKMNEKWIDLCYILIFEGLIVLYALSLISLDFFQ